MVFVAGLSFAGPSITMTSQYQTLQDSWTASQKIVIFMLEEPSSSRPWAFVNGTVPSFVSRKVKLGPFPPTRNFQAGNEGLLGVLGFLTLL